MQIFPLSPVARGDIADIRSLLAETREMRESQTDILQE